MKSNTLTLTTKTPLYLPYSLVLILCICACGSSAPEKEAAATASPSPMPLAAANEAAVQSSDTLSPTSSKATVTTMNYDVNHPDQTFSLSKKLMEVSGLSYFAPGNQLLCINDEKANIFFLSLEDGSIEKEVDFGKNDDYEGVEVVGQTIYVVKSNGNLYPYDLEQKEDGPTIKLPLRQENDIEGLGYDPTQHQLLLACKGSPNLEGHEKLKKTKAVYAYDLQHNAFIDEPVLLIKDDELVAWVERSYADADLSKKKRSKLVERAKDISPSAIAVHPASGNYFILSTVGKVMAIFDSAKQLEQVLFLDEDVHAQPEGICFTPNGTMYISNEGRGLVAKIHRFNAK